MENIRKTLSRRMAKSQNELLKRVWALKCQDVEDELFCVKDNNSEIQKKWLV